MNNELLKQCKDEVARLRRNNLNTDPNIQSFWMDVCERYASLRSKELQERVETLSDAVRELIDANKKMAQWIVTKDPDAPFTGMEAHAIGLSALSGEATKEGGNIREQERELWHKQQARIHESLEAYNRECKRVDELTEEVGQSDIKILTLQDTIELQRKRIQELEGLLREITASFDANDDYRFTNVKIKRMLNLL